MREEWVQDTKILTLLKSFNEQTPHRLFCSMPIISWSRMEAVSIEQMVEDNANLTWRATRSESGSWRIGAIEQSENY